MRRVPSVWLVAALTLPAGYAVPAAVRAEPTKLQATEAFTLKGHKQSVLRLAFLKKAKGPLVLVSAGEDGAIRLWDLAKHTELAVVTQYGQPVTALGTTADGRLVASANQAAGGLVRLHAQPGKELLHFGGPKTAGPVNALDFSADGELLAAGTDDSSVRLWRVALRKEAAPVRAKAEVVSVAFSPVVPKGKTKAYTLAAGTSDGSLQLLQATLDNKNRLDLAALPIRFGGHFKGVTRVTFSPDGTLLASAGQDGTIRLWKSTTGREVQRITATPDKTVEWIAFDSEGQWVAAALADNLVKVWEVSGGREVLQVQGHEHPVTCVAFSPDGRQLITASRDFTIKVWNLAGPGVPPLKPKKP